MVKLRSWLVRNLRTGEERTEKVELDLESGDIDIPAFEVESIPGTETERSSFRGLSAKMDEAEETILEGDPDYDKLNPYSLIPLGFDPRRESNSTGMLSGYLNSTAWSPEDMVTLEADFAPARSSVLLTSDMVASLADMASRWRALSGNVLEKCQHCGQWGAVMCQCRHCGAPIDPGGS